MGSTKIFQIVAYATLFSTAVTVNALVKHAGDDCFHTSSPASTQRVTPSINGGVVPPDGILLGDRSVTHDGVVLGDQSIFCSGVSRFGEKKRESGRFVRDGVVLGDGIPGFISGQTS